MYRAPSLCLSSSLFLFFSAILLTTTRGGNGVAVISLFAGHDASIAVSKDGYVQCVLELERLFDIRYYELGCSSRELPTKGSLRNELLRALHVVQDRCVLDDGESPSHFEHGVIAKRMCPTWVEQDIPAIVAEVFTVKQWQNVSHHQAHALIGFYTSPLPSPALVVSYDGGGDDGTFNVYTMDRTSHQLSHLSKIGMNLGEAYIFLGSLLTEVTHVPIDGLCLASAERKLKPATSAEDGWVNLGGLWTHGSYNGLGTAFGNTSKRLSIAGKLMGYSATGELVAEISQAVRQFFMLGTHA